MQKRWVDFPPYPLNHQCDFKEVFFWNDGGEIREKQHCDGEGNPLRSIEYKYDDRGNVVEETFVGDITGTGKKENYTKKATYSGDGLNLLLSEILPSGLEVKYEYLPSTNLLTKRSTLSGGDIVREESFHYDQDHCLIQAEEKSALVYRLEKVTPSKEIPFGYPLEKKIYGMGPDGESLLESYHYRYNNRGDVTLEERRNKNGQLIYSIERRFDPHGNCVEEEDSLGRYITRKFDPNDNCTEEAGPRPGLLKTMRYDYMNRCVEEIIFYGDDNWMTHHSYNHFSHRVKTANYLGHETNTTFDRYGRPLEISLPLVRCEGFLQKPIIRKKHDPFGNEIETTDPLEHTTSTKFTARDKPYEIIHPDGKSQKIVYSIEGLPVEVTDEDKVITTFTYDPLGRVLSKQTPHGKELYNYIGLHLVEKIDMEKVSTTFTYDLFGRLLETKTENRREVISYDEMGHPYKKMHYQDDKLLSIEISRVDPLGKTLETYLEDPSGEIFNHKRFIYDASGNCIEEWNGDSKIERTFDGLNRVRRVIEQEKYLHQVIYNHVEHDGQLVEEKTVVDPNLQQVITLYDALGRESVIRHLNPFGVEVRRKEITYDLAGHVVKEETITEKDKRTLLKEVDTRGRVISIVEPLKKVTRMSYSGTGNLEVLTKPDGIQLTHTYVNGRLVSLTSSDHQLEYHYRYSRRGELIEVLDQLTGLKSTQTFSLLGELIEEVLPTGETIAYTYDGLGRMTSYSLPDGGKALLAYNARAVTSVTRLDHTGQPLYQHAYTKFDKMGNVIEERLIGQGGNISYSFDQLYQLVSIFHPAFEQKNLLYDPAGNLLSYDKNGEHFSFSYDDLYQLTTEKDHNYTYDTFYNRTSKDEEPYEINELNQLLSASDTTYTYDLNGNLLQLENSLQKIFFIYDPLNRLTSIDNGEEKVSFTYDSFHRRLTRNGIPFHFCREHEIGFENALRLLGPGLGGDIGAAIAIELDGTPFAPLHDHQGSIIALLDLDGNLTASWSYTAYGELIGEALSPWGFSSKRQEPLTHWISFGRRDYDPATGRWTTPDPLGFEAGPNLYTYVFNRPLTHRDPLGLTPDDALNQEKNSNVITFNEFENNTSIWDFLSTCAFAYYNYADSISPVDFSDHLDRDYPVEMYLYDKLCNLEELEDDDSLLVYTNGMATTKERFEATTKYFHDMGFNVVGILVPPTEMAWTIYRKMHAVHIPEYRGNSRKN